MVLPAWVGWQAAFAPNHREEEEGETSSYAYHSTFPRIMPFLGFNVSTLYQQTRMLASLKVVLPARYLKNVAPQGSPDSAAPKLKGTTQ